MEHDTKEIEDFKKLSVYVICAAGTDRSKYISEELNSRGYFASHGGILKNHNYVTKEDLFGIGTIVFSSIHEKNIFDKDNALSNYVKRNEIKLRVLNITESDKNRAHDSSSVDKLKDEISKQLDSVGMKNIKKQSS